MHALQRGPYRRQTLVAFLLASAACARQAESGPPPFTPGHGRFVWTDSASHEDKRPAYHTRCGSVLHVWVRDTLSPDLTTYMVVGILGFEDRTREVPAYADFDGRRVGAEAHDLALLSREATNSGTMQKYWKQKEATSRFVVGQLLLSDPVLPLIRREIRQLSGGLSVSTEHPGALLSNEGWG
jgi:hypothetical protein